MFQNFYCYEIYYGIPLFLNSVPKSVSVYLTLKKLQKIVLLEFFLVILILRKKFVVITDETRSIITNIIIIIIIITKT